MVVAAKDEFRSRIDRLTGRLAAAADASAEAGALEEVTVTATKLASAKVLDIPASLQAISGEMLQRDLSSGIMSIAGEVPGLSIQDLGPGDKKYVIRGINSTGDSTVGVYYGEAVITLAQVRERWTEHFELLGADIPICEHMTALGSLPDEGFRFSAVPPKVKGMGTFPVRAYAVLG